MQLMAMTDWTSKLGAGAAIAAMMMTLVGCGGGGSTGGPTVGVTPPASTAPTVPTTPTSPAPGATGTAELTWTAPTQNEDGSALTNLAGYKVRYGQAPAALGQVLDIASPTRTSATIEGLTSGRWYFTVASYTNTGVESAPTGAVSKDIN